MAVMVGKWEKFNNNNSGEFCAKTKWHKNSPELLFLKFVPLTYHHSHLLAATLDFTSFFTIAFLRAAFFFYSLAVLDKIYIIYVYVPLSHLRSKESQCILSHIVTISVKTHLVRTTSEFLFIFSALSA